MASKHTKRNELVAYTLQTGAVECAECGWSVEPGERFYHHASSDTTACSVICAGALRARGSVRPFARAA
jgi:hypothetical protein